jgi:hypothetical protein
MRNIRSCDWIYIVRRIILRSINSSIKKENEMNLLKHLDAVVIVAVALTFSAAAIAKEPVRAAKAPTVANSSKMIKVVITGKRLSKAEKAQLAAL